MNTKTTGRRCGANIIHPVGKMPRFNLKKVQKRVKSISSRCHLACCESCHCKEAYFRTATVPTFGEGNDDFYEVMFLCDRCYTEYLKNDVPF